MKQLPIPISLMIAGLSLFMGSHPVAAQGSQFLNEHSLLDLNVDWTLNHQGVPMGVPKDYEWISKPRIEAGNQPTGFTALTGWGHVFWSKDSVGHPGDLQIRNFHTFICSGDNKDWKHVQSGPLEGAQFLAGFQNNLAKKPAKFVSDGVTATVLFDAGTAFHFWPARGRSRLPMEEICGVVVILEARTVAAEGFPPSLSGGYLIGLGADYWSDMAVPWNNFKTNKGVGLARLRRVGTHWAWYGMSTASNHDLQRLHASGLLSAIR